MIYNLKPDSFSKTDMFLDPKCLFNFFHSAFQDTLSCLMDTSVKWLIMCVDKTAKLCNLTDERKNSIFKVFISNRGSNK